MLNTGWEDEEAILFLFRFPKSCLFSEIDLKDKRKKEKITKKIFAEIPLAHAPPRQLNSAPCPTLKFRCKTLSFLPGLLDEEGTLCCQSGSYRLNNSPVGRE